MKVELEAVQCRGLTLLVVEKENHDKVVAEVLDYEPNTAKLFSASPELLAACVEFVRKVDCGEAISTKSYNQMKAAIEKATHSMEK